MVECSSHSGPDVELAEVLEVRLVTDMTAASLSGPDVELTETSSSLASLLGPELELAKRLLDKNDLETLSNDFITSRSDLLGVTAVTGQELGSFTNHLGPFCQADPVISLSGEAPRVSMSET